MRTACCANRLPLSTAGWPSGVAGCATPAPCQDLQPCAPLAAPCPIAAHPSWPSGAGQRGHSGPGYCFPQLASPRPCTAGPSPTHPPTHPNPQPPNRPSQVGHNALGAGQLIDQGAALVDKALASGSIFEGEGWKYISPAFEANTLHFIGLLSDGGVHSRTDQLYGCIRGAAERGAKRIR